MKFPRVLFYISGHGYGHATRTCEIIRELLSTSAVKVFVRTAAPAMLFRNVDVSLHKAEIDCGVAEASPLRVDADRTVGLLRTLRSQSDQIVAREREFLQDNRIDLVVSDVPHLAGSIAAAAAVPCIGISNFTWDWIYEPLLESHQDGPAIVDWIRDCYAEMCRFLKIPFGPDRLPDVFAEVKDVPIVARQSRRSRQDLLSEIGIEVNDPRPRVLFGMRGPNENAALDDAMRCGQDYLFLIYGFGRNDRANVSSIDQSRVSFDEALAISDVVVAKLGYSTVAECIAAGAAILWPRRSGFREDEITEQYSPDYVRMLEIPTENFSAGDWSPYIKQLLHLPMPPCTAAVNGAEVCACQIRECLALGQ